MVSDDKSMACFAHTMMGDDKSMVSFAHTMVSNDKTMVCFAHTMERDQDSMFNNLTDFTLTSTKNLQALIIQGSTKKIV